MNGLLFDTNVPSEFSRPRPQVGVVAWVDAQPLSSIYLSVISLGELRKGFLLSPETKRQQWLESWYEESLLPMFSGHVLPVTRAIAEIWGSLSAESRRSGRVLPPADGLIAATALAHGLVLVTRNTKDFQQTGVKLFNPWEL